MPDSSFYDLQSLAFSTVTVSVVTLLCLGPAAWAFPREYQSALRSWILGTAAMVLSDVLFLTSQEQPWCASASRVSRLEDSAGARRVCRNYARVVRSREASRSRPTMTTAN